MGLIYVVNLISMAEKYSLNGIFFLVKKHKYCLLCFRSDMTRPKEMAQIL